MSENINKYYLKVKNACISLINYLLFLVLFCRNVNFGPIKLFLNQIDYVIYLILSYCKLE